MPAKKLKDYLDKHDVKYITIKHSPAYTAQEIAACAHVRGQELAKTVVVSMDGTKAMVVLPASERVNLERLRTVTDARKVELTAEEEFERMFPDCEVGAMPPFGNLYNLPSFVTPHLAEDEEIAFNAGTHTELIKMKYKDFEKLVKPKVLAVAELAT